MPQRDRKARDRQQRGAPDRRQRRERDRQRPDGRERGAATGRAAQRPAPDRGERPGTVEPTARRGGVRVAATGNPAAELVETVPITRRDGEAPAVAMALSGRGEPDLSLPDLRAGDRLEVYAELEVTTDLEQEGPGLVGTPYSYAPQVTTRLELAGEAGARRRLAIGKPRRKNVDHERHHEVIVREEAIEIPARGLPWQGPSRVELVVEATSPEAKPGNVLLVGQNEPDGRVLGDMGQIGALRLRPGHKPTGQTLRADGPLVDGIPVAKGTRTVVLSVQLDDLAADEQLRIRAQLDTSAVRLGYPARITTRAFLAESPQQTEPGGVGAQCASFKGHVSKANGFNCMPHEQSSRSVKVGVLRVTATPPGPLCVNVVAVSADPFKRGKPGDQLAVTGGACEVVRFAPQLLG